MRAAIAGFPAARQPSIPGYPLPPFPRKRESKTVLPYNAAYLSIHLWIPAYAGMTVSERDEEPERRRLPQPIARRRLPPALASSFAKGATLSRPLESGKVGPAAVHCAAAAKAAGLGE